MGHSAIRRPKDHRGGLPWSPSRVRFSWAMAHTVTTRTASETAPQIIENSRYLRASVNAHIEEKVNTSAATMATSERAIVASIFIPIS